MTYQLEPLLNPPSFIQYVELFVHFARENHKPAQVNYMYSGPYENVCAFLQYK